MGGREGGRGGKGGWRAGESVALFICALVLLDLGVALRRSESGYGTSVTINVG